MYKVKFLLVGETDLSKSIYLSNTFEHIVDFAKWCFDKKLELAEDHWEDSAKNKYYTEEVGTKIEVLNIGRCSYKEDSKKFLLHLDIFLNGVTAIVKKDYENGRMGNYNFDLYLS